jgi:hypothetical protein
MGFNHIEEQEALWIVPQLKNVNILVITGNPLGMAGEAAYAQLEASLSAELSAVLINDVS